MLFLLLKVEWYKSHFTYFSKSVNTFIEIFLKIFYITIVSNKENVNEDT